MSNATKMVGRSFHVECGLKDKNNFLDGPTVSFDPENWSELKATAHQMVEDMFDYLATVRERPVWQPMPPSVRKNLKESIPNKSIGLKKTYNDFLENVLPYPFGNIHPRFFAWANGTGCPVGVLAELLKAAMNSHVGYPSPMDLIENQVLDWLKEMLDFPMEAGGVLVSGGSKANLVALTVARNSKATCDIKKEGVFGCSKRMMVYTSERAHFSVQRAVEVIGLGGASIRKVKVDRNFKIDTAELSSMIESDLNAGLQPFCIVGNAGTTSTGAIDNLDSMADIAKKYNLWFHIDGAIGAVANISPKVKPLLKGMSRADSIAFDLHKWFQTPYEAGCVFIKDIDKQRETFNWDASYIKKIADRPKMYFSEAGIQLSREFRALKIWMSIRTHGLDKYRALIEQNLNQANYLGSLIDSHPALTLMAPISLSIVCFRFVNPKCSEDELDDINLSIIDSLKQEGIAFISQEIIDGRAVLRVCAINHRSRLEDFKLLVDEIVKSGTLLSTKAT